jgi:3-hydroxybutyryl-CoA dehydrogenase
MERIGVIGCGLMGSGIAEVAARSGYLVTVVESTPDALEAGRGRLEASLDKAVLAGKLSADDRDATLARLTFSNELADLIGVGAVLEAVSEQAELKFDLFATLDTLLDASVVLASNTSSIPIHRLAAVTAHPERVVGLHFFNPVPSMKLVEVISAPQTSLDTVRQAHDLAGRLNKTAITAPDQAGFIVNYLLIPYLLSAIRLFESGQASAEDIDTGMVLGCGHPMGPLRLTDLIGLDTTLAIAELLYASYAEPTMAPPALLRDMVNENKCGRKSGHGFFSYPH